MLSRRQGRRVIANDVIYSIKRLADPAVQSTDTGFVANKIKGIDGFFKKAPASRKSGLLSGDAGLQGG